QTHILCSGNVGQSAAIHVEVEAMLMAIIGDGADLGNSVAGAVFGGVGQANDFGERSVETLADPCLYRMPQLVEANFAVVVREGIDVRTEVGRYSSGFFAEDVRAL